jgi:hypothetical protein
LSPEARGTKGAHMVDRTQRLIVLAAAAVTVVEFIRRLLSI